MLERPRARARRDRAGRLHDQVESDDDRAPPAGPGAGLLGQPRPRLRRARGGAHPPSRARGRGDRDVLGRGRRASTCRSTARTSACGPSSRCAPPTGSRSASRARSRSPRASGRAPRRSSPACSPPTTSTSWRSSPRTCSVKRGRGRGPPRQRRRRALRRLRRLRPAGRGASTATRLDPPQGVEAVLVIPSEQVPTEEARKAIPEQVPLGRRRRQRLRRLRPRARDHPLRPHPDRPRPHRPPASAAPRPPLSALDGDRRRGAADGRDRRHDLGRRPDRPRLGLLAEHRRGR